MSSPPPPPPPPPSGCGVNGKMKSCKALVAENLKDIQRKNRVAKDDLYHVRQQVSALQISTRYTVYTISS